jgi:hypothetical protein
MEESGAMANAETMPRGFNPDCVRCNEFDAPCGAHGDKVYPPTSTWCDQFPVPETAGEI